MQAPGLCASFVAVVGSATPSTCDLRIVTTATPSIRGSTNLGLRSREDIVTLYSFTLLPFTKPLGSVALGPLLPKG